LWLYSQSIHLSVAGADYMIGRSAPVFRDFLTGSSLAIPRP
jgi:hypothetical protein